jgi:simple sugar transport system ATP-binding protein
MLRLVELDKRFGALIAVQSASLEVLPGRIHAVVGENGAGKSTLLKMAAGILVPDAGEVKIDRQKMTPHTASEAIRRGIGMVQQHFALVGPFTALENVVLGVEPTRRGLLDLDAARAKVQAIGRDLGVELPLDVPVERLGVGDRQRLEIARALYRDARVLILDEPTAVLTHGEAEALYATLRRLAESGKAIVVVTHKLGEVVDFADEVTVMRRGKVMMSRELRKRAGGRPGEEAAREDEIREITEAIMGGGVPDLVKRESRQVGATTIVLSDVRYGRALHGTSLEVRAGEVVGVAGVEGNGQRELVQLLSGLTKPDSGRLAIVERAILGAKRVPPVAVVHEDRQSEGLVLDADVRDNALLGEHWRYARRGVLSLRDMSRDARERLDRAQAPFGLDTPARSLSGGNQQKIVIARALAKIAMGASALVLAHPTRGVDLGASRAIHQEILAAAAKQVAVLLISSDLGELRAVCDRILVLSRGRIVAELSPAASDQEIGHWMLSGAA